MAAPKQAFLAEKLKVGEWACPRSWRTAADHRLLDDIRRGASPASRRTRGAGEKSPPGRGASRLFFPVGTLYYVSDPEYFEKRVLSSPEAVKMLQPSQTELLLSASDGFAGFMEKRKLLRFEQRFEREMAEEAATKLQAAAAYAVP